MSENGDNEFRFRLSPVNLDVDPILSLGNEIDTDQLDENARWFRDPAENDGVIPLPLSPQGSERKSERKSSPQRVSPQQRFSERKSERKSFPQRVSPQGFSPQREESIPDFFGDADAPRMLTQDELDEVLRIQPQENLIEERAEYFEAPPMLTEEEIREIERERISEARRAAAEEKENRRIARGLRRNDVQRARQERVICDICGTEVTAGNLARHQKCEGIRRARLRVLQRFRGDYGRYVAPPPEWHMPNMENTPPCPICGYRPSCHRLDNLERHIEEVHQPEKDARRARKEAARCRDDAGNIIENCFQCSECGSRLRGVSAFSNWLRHMREKHAIGGRNAIPLEEIEAMEADEIENDMERLDVN